MTCEHSIDPAATASTWGAEVADRATNIVIDALRIAIIAAPIVFSLPHIARADPGGPSPLGLFSAVSRNNAERIGVIEEATPQPARRMPVL